MDPERESRGLVFGQCWPTRFAAVLFAADTPLASPPVRLGAGGAPVAKLREKNTKRINNDSHSEKHSMKTTRGHYTAAKTSKATTEIRNEAKRVYDIRGMLQKGVQPRARYARLLP